jgi:terminal uridylyltransferase
LYQPATKTQSQFTQGQYLDTIAATEIPIVEMSQTERDEKEAFRKELEQICQDVCATDPERLPKVSIEGFGSFESGFASAGSDMDLVLVVKDADPTVQCFSPMEYDLPRSLEKRLLQLGIGAHLLTCPDHQSLPESRLDFA